MRALPLFALLLLAACGETGTQRPASIAPPPRAVSGVDRVMGHDAKALALLFGRPALDLHEGAAHKLQFRGVACVLDAYLYPPAGGGEPKVTWIDARTPAGADFDRASCVAALARR
ncbi:hypothetical protein FHS31_001788 [Sphingomonas vulcanisoli]|uniref:Lipoprotein n=1 Tax=Sphingomonas vulcanisoli TaxID=1658060 RepID=A0ABX0TX10_9SPHN|nr:hypothetical protein [Sphingomonas vulcanisoli]NIJ08171.1 hypothetical protein [Sphingomonas vulcanisoli]